MTRGCCLRLVALLGIVGLAFYQFGVKPWMPRPPIFDDDARARVNLPKNASRIVVYDEGFQDLSRWVAFSADKQEIEEWVLDWTGKRIEDLDDWPSVPDRRVQARAVEATPTPPIPPPPKSGKASKGYWDIDTSHQGKRYEGALKDQPPTNGRLYLFIDPQKWRVFLHYFTT